MCILPRRTRKLGAASTHLRGCESDLSRADRITACRLRLIHHRIRDICRRQDCGSTAAPRLRFGGHHHRSDAHRCGDRVGTIRQRRVYPFDQQGCRFGIAGDDGQVFFPAGSSDDSAFAEMCAQSVRGSPDDMIAFGMTVKIIHRFEFVDIDDDEGER